MMSRAPWVAVVALAGCASAHRLVAPLAYVRGTPAAARSDDAFGAPPPVPPAPIPRCVEWKKFTLSNGILLFVAERHALPSATVRIVLTTGAMGLGDFGDASTKGLDLLAATYLSGPDVDGDVSAQCTRDSCWIAERVRAAEAGDALGRLASRITDPQPHGKSDVHRFVAAADSLRRGEDSSAFVLWRNAEVLAFGRSSTRVAAEPTMADVIQARARLFQPSAATLVVVGDVSPAEMEVQAERAFGAWRADQEAKGHEVSGAESSASSFVPRVVHVPNNPWWPFAAIVVRGPGSTSSDVWAFRVAVQILGSGMGSELFLHVREEMAATYTPRAEVRWFPGASVATLGALLERGKVIAATRVMLSSVRALREHGPELEALERAKARSKASCRSRSPPTRFLHRLWK
jgi:zinc protease